MDNRIREILINWGLQDNNIKQVYETAWQAGNNYILKEYQDLEMLKRNLEIINILDKIYISVGKIVSPVLGNKNIQYIEYDGNFYFLSQKLPGCHLTEIENIHDTAFKMGIVIARLHLAFKKCEENRTFWNNNLLDEMNGWVKKNFEVSGWKYITNEEYGQTVLELAGLYDNLPVQLIHRDVHFGNFLFDGGEFSGYIDFDLSQRNIRIFDICYFLTGLLSEEEQIKITEEQWFGFVENVFKGYVSVTELSSGEKKAVPYVMECIELLFVAYFESINDVSCAEDAYRVYEFIKKHEKIIWENI